MAAAKRLSIRWRLVLSYVLLTLLTVSLLVLLALALMRRNIAQQESEYLAANAQAIAQQAVPLISPVLRGEDLQQLAHISAFFGNVRVRILSDEEKLVADSGDGSPKGQFVFISRAKGRRSASESYADAQYAKSMQVRWKRGPYGNRMAFEPQRDSLASDRTNEIAPTAGEPRSDRIVRLPILSGGRMLGLVEVSSGPDVEQELLMTTASSLGMAGIVATAVAALIGLFISRGLTSPLRRLSLAANRMTQGDLSARAEAPIDRAKPARDEITQLARQFDGMASQLEASFASLSSERDALRRFIADASHELRTPIATLKVYNELMQDEDRNDAAMRAEFIAESRAQVKRLEWITENLLNLSRLDAGLARLNLADHDAGELLESAAKTYKPLAEQKGVALSVNQPNEPITLHLDRAQMEMALSNLLDNALKFTPSGSGVELGAGRLGDVVQLSVCDAGVGICRADQPFVFDRFFQGANSDSRGSGLGLAIVKSIVQAHGGRVFVESELGKGSRFVIELNASKK